MPAGNDDTERQRQRLTLPLEQPRPLGRRQPGLVAKRMMDDGIDPQPRRLGREHLEQRREG